MHCTCSHREAILWFVTGWLIFLGGLFGVIYVAMKAHCCQQSTDPLYFCVPIAIVGIVIIGIVGRPLCTQNYRTEGVETCV